MPRISSFPSLALLLLLQLNIKTMGLDLMELLIPPRPRQEEPKKDVGGTRDSHVGRYIRLLKPCRIGNIGDRGCVVSETLDSLRVRPVGRIRTKRRRGTLRKEGNGTLFVFQEDSDRNNVSSLPRTGSRISNFTSRKRMRNDHTSSSQCPSRPCTNKTVETPLMKPLPAHLANRLGLPEGTPSAALHGSLSVGEFLETMRLLNLTTIDDWEKWQFHYYEKLIYHSKVPVFNDETPLQQRTNKTTSSEKCALYMVSRQSGVSVRETTDFSSPVVTRLPKDYRVVLSEIRNGRAHIVVPVDGWVSLQSRNGNHVLSKCKLPRMARPLGILQCGNLERNSRTYESPFRTSSTLAARTDPMKSSNRRQTLCWESELMKIAAQCVAKESRKS